MFDIGWSELVVIGVVALVVIGPKDLPRVMRTVGQWSGKVKRMAREFQNQFNEAVREAELEDVHKEVADLARMDPMADIHKDLAALDANVRTEPTAVDAAPTVPGSGGVMTPLAKPLEPVATTAPVKPPEPAGAPSDGDKP